MTGIPPQHAAPAEPLPGPGHLTWMRTFLIVSGCALTGMLMGGIFGYVSGNIAPQFFSRVVPWVDSEPVGMATFLGATIGVLLGGGLGVFSVVVHFLLQLVSGRRAKASAR